MPAPSRTCGRFRGTRGVVPSQTQGRCRGIHRKRSEWYPHRVAAGPGWEMEGVGTMLSSVVPTLTSAAIPDQSVTLTLSPFWVSSLFLTALVLACGALWFLANMY